MLRFLYTLLAALALPFASLVVLWRGLRERAYWHGWGARFGRGARPARSAARALWVHAVSVGEVQAADEPGRCRCSARWPALPLVRHERNAGRARACARRLRPRCRGALRTL